MFPFYFESDFVFIPGSGGPASGLGLCTGGDAGCNGANKGGTCTGGDPNHPSGFSAGYCECNPGFSGLQCGTGAYLWRVTMLNLYACASPFSYSIPAFVPHPPQSHLSPNHIFEKHFFMMPPPPTLLVFTFKLCPSAFSTNFGRSWAMGWGCSSLDSQALISCFFP